MRTILGLFSVCISMLVLSPATSSAQSTGCPWCTSPTTCGEVQENGSIGGCYNFGAGCQTVPGSCQISDSFASIGHKELLRRNGMEFGGSLVAELWGSKVELTKINNGLYAEWACDGQLSSIFKMSADGRLVELNTGLYGQRFTINQRVAVPERSPSQGFSLWTAANAL